MLSPRGRRPACDAGTQREHGEEDGEGRHEKGGGVWRVPATAKFPHRNGFGGLYSSLVCAVLERATVSDLQVEPKETALRHKRIAFAPGLTFPCCSHGRVRHRRRDVTVVVVDRSDGQDCGIGGN